MKFVAAAAAPPQYCLSINCFLFIPGSDHHHHMASSSTRSTRCHNIAPFDYIFIIGACRNPVVAIGIPDETHAPTNRPLMMTHRIASSAVTGIPRITNLRQRRRRRLFCHNSIKRSIERELKHTTVHHHPRIKGVIQPRSSSSSVVLLPPPMPLPPCLYGSNHLQLTYLFAKMTGGIIPQLHGS